MSLGGRRRLGLAAMLGTCLHTVCAADAIRLRVLSGRPDMLSGGDALVEVRAPALNGAAITLNGRDVTASFRSGRTPGTWVGRIEGMANGSNTVLARAGGQTAALELRNHPITGPIFSGPHQKPFVCRTEEAGLGPALDADCSAKTVVNYFYKSTQPPERGRPADPTQPPPGFKPLDPGAPLPADVARTTTAAGATVPYIVRRESGTINRAIYHIVFLHEPGTPLPDPWTSSAGWNGRLVYLFGGGCKAGYHQGRTFAGLDDAMLSKGYAEAVSSLNIFGNNCDDVISAETLMMVKEYFTERFGVPVHTIGFGGSGGSIQQHLIAQNYPGLLDGIIPAASFPDVVSLLPAVVDCSLLGRAFDTSAQPWTEEQKTAVSGFATWKTCGSWIASRFSPGWIRADNCDASVPKGTRCSLFENEVNVYGRDPKTGFARSPLDNVGVQYGLAAFQTGRITAEQFLDVNERIGGYDADGNMVAERTVADPQALRIAYETGRVNSARGLALLPIIDTRGYADKTGNLHDRVRSFAMRARLVRASGGAGNQVILTNPTRDVDHVRLMDEWLDNIARDSGAGTSQERIARNKPAGLEDACWSKTGKTAEPVTYGAPGTCNELFPPFGDPRMAAGAPLAGDILKCALKPVDAADYSQPLTPEQLARLRAIFPEGVCDYSQPGVGQGTAAGAWRVY